VELFFRFGIYHVPHSQTDRDKKQTRNPTETGEDLFFHFFFFPVQIFHFSFSFTNFRNRNQKKEKKNKFVRLICCRDFQCRKS